jgi:quinol monooxygenase YgiN
MYGTVARMKLLPGQSAALQQLLDEWWSQRGPKTGAVAHYVYQPDARPGEQITVVVFKDKESYQKNAEDPAQHQWYLKLRALLAEDPVWDDGEVISTRTA